MSTRQILTTKNRRSKKIRPRKCVNTEREKEINIHLRVPTKRKPKE